MTGTAAEHRLAAARKLRNRRWQVNLLTGRAGKIAAMPAAGLPIGNGAAAPTRKARAVERFVRIAPAW